MIAQVVGSPPPILETPSEFLDPSFRLVQTQLLQAYEKWAADKNSLSLPFFQIEF